MVGQEGSRVVGQEGSGVGGGKGWVAIGRLYLPLEHSSAVSSVSDRNRLNPQDKSKQSLAAV